MKISGHTRRPPGRHRDRPQGGVNHFFALARHGEPWRIARQGELIVIRRLAAAAALAAGAIANPVLAGPAVSIDSAIYVEHHQLAGGNAVRRLEPAQHLNHGDRVVTVVNWYRLAGTGSFTVVNALPARLAYQGSARDEEEVSVDGGRSWGHLGGLRVGTRLATLEDVTHVRWHITADQAQSGAGRIAYSGFVR
jgi:hypothetical protein